MKTLPFWFRQKYNLPPNDPRFLALTPEEIETEFWAYQYEAVGITEYVEGEEIDIEALLAEADEYEAAHSADLEEVINAKY